MSDISYFPTHIIKVSVFQSSVKVDNGQTLVRRYQVIEIQPRSRWEWMVSLHLCKVRRGVANSITLKVEGRIKDSHYILLRFARFDIIDFSSFG